MNTYLDDIKSSIDIYMPVMFNSYNCLLFILLQRKGDVMIRHIAALQISGPRELRRDMLFSVGTGLIIKPL